MRTPHALPPHARPPHPVPPNSTHPRLGLLILAVSGLALLAPRPCGAADPPGGTPLTARVEGAIDRGAAFLMDTFRGRNLGPVMRGYPLGSRALIAYALLESGVAAEDPFILQLFEEMEVAELEQVYGVSLYVLALNAWKRHAVQVAVAGARGTEVSSDRLPGGAKVLDEIESCIEWLVNVRRRGHGSWGYGVLEKTNDPWTDYSNTQFAALALHVGVLEGIDIPSRVFEEIVGTFSSNAFAGKDEIEISVDRTPWLEARTADEEDGTTVAAPARDVALVGRPISWGYRPLSVRERRGLGGSGAWGTTSMTAAAVSTLLVADHGLSARRAIKRKLRAAIDVMVGGGVIELSRAWHPARERREGTMHRNHYYTLYSFEKAMDLAGIGVLDGTDWYRGQVPHLLDDQGKDGSWGRSSRSGNSFEYEQMSTAFALLFLRRATSHLTVFESPPIITHEAGAEVIGGDLATGRVFVESLGGAISLDELFGRLQEDRAGRWFSAADAVIDSVPPESRPELLRWFLPLFSAEVPERVREFARGRAAGITGLAADADRARYEEWRAKWGRLRDLAGLEGSAAFVDEIAEILATSELGVPLRSEAIIALRRTGSLTAVPSLLTALEDPELPLRIAAARSLRFLTSENLPFDPEGTVAERSNAIAAWRAWWEIEGDELHARRLFDRLKQRLDRAESAAERAQLRAEIVAIGPGILPRIEKIIAGKSYAFDWILVRQALTGEAGIR